jgi:threonine dehydratase
MTTYLGAYTFAIIRSQVQHILTVSDEALVETMRFLLERMKILVEPTGCLAAAAALTGVYPCAGRRIGVILSGGNIDLKSLGRFLGEA